MNTKKIAGYIKLTIGAGKATPAPPVGPALGQKGLNIPEFCKAFNDATKDLESGSPTPVVITAFEDRTFTFVTKSPPASFLLMKAAGVEKGSSTPNKVKVGKVTKKALADIAKVKRQDMNGVDEAGLVATLAGTARSMGIEVEG
jgi:large subunit ribosomal protein L11